MYKIGDGNTTIFVRTLSHIYISPLISPLSLISFSLYQLRSGFFLQQKFILLCIAISCVGKRFSLDWTPAKSWLWVWKKRNRRRNEMKRVWLWSTSIHHINIDMFFCSATIISWARQQKNIYILVSLACTSIECL